MKYTEEFYQNIWQTVNDFIQETEYQSLEPDVDFQYCEDKGNELFCLLSEKEGIQLAEIEDLDMKDNVKKAIFCSHGSSFLNDFPAEATEKSEAAE